MSSLVSEPSDAVKPARIELKTSPEVKEMLEQAAMLSGISLTAFVIGQAQQKARELIADSSTIKFPTEAWQQLNQTIERPAQAKPELRAFLKGRRNARKQQG